MGYDIGGIGIRNFWTSLLVVVLIAALCYAAAYYIAQKEADPKQAACAIWPILLLAFLLLAWCVLLVAADWAVRIWGTMARARAPSDIFRELYETRSMLAGAHTIVLAACALFIPFLVELWNNSTRLLNDQLGKLISLIDHPELPPEKQHQLQRAIMGLVELRGSLRWFSSTVRPLFWLGVWITALTTIASGIAYVQLDHRVAYLIPALIAVVGSLLFLWNLMLVSAFLLIVQTPLHRYDHVNIMVPDEEVAGK